MMLEDLPPSEQFREDWRDRVSAAGAEFSSDDHVQIVTEIEAEAGKDAFLRALTVDYTTAEGTEHSVTTNGSLKVAAAECDGPN